MNMKGISALFILLAAGMILVVTNRSMITSFFFKPTVSTIPEGAQRTDATAPRVVVDGLNIPWELAFLPGGDMLVTERGGRLLRIGAGKTPIEVHGVIHLGEGGLLGLALDPDFAQNSHIYLYLTTLQDTVPINHVERYTLNGTTLSERTVILSGIAAANNHDGGRIAFGPDGMLYVTTGDAGNSDAAQDTQSLSGKILRINRDGSLPVNNPFGNEVYSYGHRNVQGIAWDDRGHLWATDHGRSGILSGYDEVNKIVSGGNYGWPTIQGDETEVGMISPQLHSGPSDTWAPSGMTYLHGHLIFAGLRGEALYVTDSTAGTATRLTKYLSSMYGRLRTVTVGPDGMLYILTNNRDSRGDPVPEDDRIILVDPASLGL